MSKSQFNSENATIFGRKINELKNNINKKQYCDEESNISQNEESEVQESNNYQMNDLLTKSNNLATGDILYNLDFSDHLYSNNYKSPKTDGIPDAPESKKNNSNSSAKKTSDNTDNLIDENENRNNKGYEYAKGEQKMAIEENENNNENVDNTPKNEETEEMKKKSFRPDNIRITVYRMIFGSLVEGSNNKLRNYGVPNIYKYIIQKPYDDFYKDDISSIKEEEYKELIIKEILIRCNPLNEKIIRDIQNFLRGNNSIWFEDILNTKYYEFIRYYNCLIINLKFCELFRNFSTIFDDIETGHLKDKDNKYKETYMKIVNELNRDRMKDKNFDKNFIFRTRFIED